MSRLKSRQMQIPGGMIFVIPQLKWQARQGSSLDSIVQQAIGVLKGNPVVAKKLGWDLSVNAMTDRVDSFNAEVCLRMGWNDYVADASGGTAAPKSQPPQQQSVVAAAAASAKRIWAGVKTLNEWLDSDEPGVPAPQAEARAATCAPCPLNGQGDLTRWFTVPAAEMIRRQLARVQERNLATSQDDKLNICEACACPMKLKVWTPMPYIQKYLKPDVIAELKKAPRCWILAELNLV